MKKVILIFLFVFTTQFLTAQESKTNKLQFRSISYGLGILNSSVASLDDGISSHLDATAKLNDHLFGLHLGGGSQLISLFGQSSSYGEINFLYGREYELKKWCKIELHGGLGYYSESFTRGPKWNWNWKGLKDDSNKNSPLKSDDDTSKTKTKSTIGFPLRIKLLFYTSKKFSLGFNQSFNFNTISKIASFNIQLQYTFKH